MLFKERGEKDTITIVDPINYSKERDWNENDYFEEKGDNMLFAMFFWNSQAVFSPTEQAWSVETSLTSPRHKVIFFWCKIPEFCASLKNIIFNSGVCSHYWWQYCHHRGHHAWTGQGFMILMDERRWLFWRMIVVTDYWIIESLKCGVCFFFKNFLDILSN